MAEPTFSPADKLRCAQRELAQRRRVYDGLVSRGRMSRAQADREIALMSAIAADYREQAEANSPDLFAGQDLNPVAAALEYQQVAARQGNVIMRLRIALKVMLESGHTETIALVRRWFEEGANGPIPYPDSVGFGFWANEQGIANVDGFMGYRFTAELLPHAEARHVAG